jgi:hypothetical protein
VEWATAVRAEGWSAAFWPHDRIDAVKPRRTFYTLEAMPWIFSDTPDSYLELMRAIDRPGPAS